MNWQGGAEQRTGGKDYVDLGWAWGGGGDRMWSQRKAYELSDPKIRETSMIMS